MKAEYTLDFRGSITPIMLLKMTQMFSQMDVEDIMEIQGSDPDTQKDLFTEKQRARDQKIESRKHEIQKARNVQKYFRVFILSCFRDEKRRFINPMPAGIKPLPFFESWSLCG